jgi:DNA-directed RNA polymerase sigma subunit (sigma70/sigma32)
MTYSVSDIELIDKIKNGAEKERESSLKEIENRHNGIFYKMVKIYAPKNSSDREDIVNDRLYIFYTSALKFDPTRSTKFSSFLANETRWVCQNLNNKINRHPTESEDCLKNVAAKEDSSCNSDKESLLYLARKIIDENLDNRTSKIFKYRYFEKDKINPWRCVAKKIGLSIQGCIRIHNKALEKITKSLEKYDYSK